VVGAASLRLGQRAGDDQPVKNVRFPPAAPSFGWFREYP